MTYIRPVRRWGTVLALAWLALATTLALPAAAQRGVTVTGEIEEMDITKSSQDRSIPLDPDRGAVVRVRVTNDSARTLLVRTVRVEGKVMGLAFFAYDTAVDMEIPSGESDEREFKLDLVGLKGQAVGLIPSYVVLLDEDRNVLATQPFVADVSGNMRSVYGIFGIVIAAFTAYSLLSVIFRLVGRRLPPNRWSRALQFATPGLGLGLTLVFTLSALRIFHPEADIWIPLVFGSLATMFVIGYLTPAPAYDEDEEEEEGDEEDVATQPTMKTTVPLFRRTTAQLTQPQPDDDEKK